VALGLLAYCSSSYSDTVYGQTQNAAAAGLTWGMYNVLPQQAGLIVSGVIYRYTTVKNAEDDMIVHVQNENALGSGYIFRSSDDWSGVPGNSINKLVPVNDIPIEYWGMGSIEVEGQGWVEEPVVIYNYSYQPCFDPQSDPTCPGYIDPSILTIIDPMQYVKDPLEDELIQAELEKKAEEDDENEEEKDRERMEKLEKLESLEKLLGGVNATIADAIAQAKFAELTAMQLPTSYNTQLVGGVYRETIELQDAKMPSNPSGRRVGLAQQLLHEEMVQSQYRSTK
jgi:hypothetical protein